MPEQWGGWNTGNVFNYGLDADLNPLAAQYGMQRDEIAGQRNAYLQPKFAQYRAALGPGADAGDAALFGNQDFRSFVQSGQLPKPQTPAQQWNATPSASPMTGGGDLMSLLMQRAQQGAAPSRTDPTIRAQSDAFSAQAGRASRNYLADLAEKAGPYANLQGETRMAAERLGQQTGAFEAELLGRETGARRDEIAQALQLWGNLLSNDQRLGLERELAQLNLSSRNADRAQQQDQFLRELALREYDLGNTWDYRWMGL